MAEGYEGEEIQVGNRRLRKIKRPKQHGGPIMIGETQGEFIPPYSIEDDKSYDIQEADLTRQTSYVTEDPDFYAEGQARMGANYMYGAVEKKKVVWIALACVILGLVFGKLFFASSQVVQNGLQGVVLNPEVPKGRSRCGMVEKTQGCVLYVMNPQRQELNGRDFYDLASQLTGRQRFVIETGNMRYSSVKVRPGAIAQLNIPPLQ